MQNRFAFFVVAFALLCTPFLFAATDIEIVSPRGGETYLAGQSQLIRLAATTKFKLVQIDLSRDGGTTFTPLGSINNAGAANTRNMLTFAIQGPASVNCRIRATATQGKINGIGVSGDFTINVSGTGALPPMGQAGGDLTGAFPSPQIANNAVTTPKLADGAVTSAKVNSGVASSNFVLAADGNGGANWTTPLSILPLVGAPYVLKSGDTMTGALTLNADPSANLHAATKQYADAETTRAKAAETTLAALVTTGNATPGDILAGKSALVNGSLVVGIVPPGANVTGANGNLSITIPNGLYSGSTTATATDAFLVPSNIKSGVSIFGVLGAANFITTYPAPVVKTGQTTSYDANDDGALQKGVTPPNPRFTDNNDGTVTDNLTGLIWLKNANAFGGLQWSQALFFTNILSNGTAGLSDGSTAGQWRVPNIRELQSLIDFSNQSPVLTTGHPFTRVGSTYWSSTTCKYNTGNAWCVSLTYGSTSSEYNGSVYVVWPVRGGQ
ncbi:MAG: DUF1566 domain-containing protein [Planctomycetota bacterium]